VKEILAEIDPRFGARKPPLDIRMTFGTCRRGQVRVALPAMEQEPRIRKDIQRRPQALV
jgi:hypothetical protein